MEPVTLDTFRRNAYRILGLQATATQEQLDSAARLMRLHADGDAPPTPNDALWLGPVPRNQSDIDDAVMRLTHPLTRSAERLWWFCNALPSPAPLSLSPAASTEAKVCHRHDETLATLCRLLIAAAGIESLDQWRQVLSDCRGVASSEAYLQWQLAIEQSGDFEKQASLDEVAASQSQMAGKAAMALVSMADGLVNQEAYVAAGRIVGMLRQSGDRNEQAQGAAERILDRLEDTLAGHCNDCMAQLIAAWDTGQTYVLQSASVQAEVRCQIAIENLCRELLKQSAADEDRSQRVRGQVVKVYSHIADAYEACMDKYAARAVLVKSMSVAQGTPMEPRLQERIESLAPGLPEVDAVITGNGGGNWSDNWRDTWSESSSGSGRRNSGWGKWSLVPIGVIGVLILFICTGTLTTRESYNPKSYDQSQFYRHFDLDRPKPPSPNFSLPPGVSIYSNSTGPAPLSPQAPLSISPFNQQNSPSNRPRGFTPQQPALPRSPPSIPSYPRSTPPTNSRGR